MKTEENWGILKKWIQDIYKNYIDAEKRASLAKRSGLMRQYHSLGNAYKHVISEMNRLEAKP